MARWGAWQGWLYRCQRRHCVRVPKAELDEYIERIVVAWLTTADVHAALHQPTTDRDTAAACAEAQRLRTRLEEYKQQADIGEIDAPDYARFSKNLKALIAAAEERAKEKSLPPVLRGRIGKHAAKEWAALADNLSVKREIIREILSIELLADADNPAFGPTGSTSPGPTASGAEPASGLVKVRPAGAAKA